jgi:hypothetical protein
MLLYKSKVRNTMDMIGFDTYFNHDAFKSAQVTPQAMLNDAEIPCDTCELATSCATNFTECSAFRTWSKNGQFKDSDVGRFVRAMK